MSRIETAQPFAFEFDIATSALVIIDMQRDFVEPGGFGASLGNDVTRLQAIIPTCAAVLAAWRAAGGFVVHTREGHAPDLHDCPPSKRDRGQPTLRIGDVGPMGRVLVIGEPGHGIVPALAPIAGELVVDKPGKGAFYATPLGPALQQLWQPLCSPVPSGGPATFRLPRICVPAAPIQPCRVYLPLL